MTSTFTAQTLVATSVSEDRSHFEMTFIDACGARHTMSIPSGVAIDLIPVLEQLAADRKQARGPDFTRIPQQFEVGCAVAERMVLVRFDGEPPYGLGLEIAEALGRELQEQSESVSLTKRPALH